MSSENNPRDKGPVIDVCERCGKKTEISKADLELTGKKVCWGCLLPGE